ncbi:MAG: UDP-N-acetylglucosamine 2-epimerase (non-hydrolyzing), partial [Thiomicrospira sp.]|uniref:non-hydrolyzing UDP-N-acetylglucosamine 2-epimerase n=1 Tax=Thiomicrospira sp. TaxID=935 RepID=UPI0019DE4344
GARPQFIKAGSVSREILRQREAGADITEVIVHTGQHYDANMSDVFFEEMQIPKPDYFLGIGGKTHGAMTGQMIEKIEEILVQEKPDWVMVYGDTNSTLAGAIAASKLHIKIAHVEAGLRSFNMRMPEEVNRILTDRISSMLFCPTQAAVDNLNKEGIDNWKTDAKVLLSGDVMQDGAMFYQALSEQPPGLVIKDDFVLCTIHRAENTDDPKRLSAIFEALNEIAENQQVVLPLHPRTKKIIQELQINIQNLTIIDPVGYLNMVWLIDHCAFVMTDSGGLQKEAYFFAKPCITLRDETEWVELVEAGANVLVGADKTKILDAFKNHSKFNIENSKLDLYGGGKASERIVLELLNG